MYLRVCGGDPRHGSGAPVRDVRSLFRPARAQNRLGQIQTPAARLSKSAKIAIDALDGGLNGALDRQLRYGIRAGLVFEIHFGALLMELLLVPLSSQCHRVLIHFRQGTCSSFFCSLHALKIRVFRQRAPPVNDL
jgi:hypothetical protein